MKEQNKELTGYPSIDKPWLKYYNNPKEIQIENISVYEYFINQDVPLDSVAIDYYGNKILYKKVIEKIGETQNRFLALGLKKGDVVTLCVPTVPEIYYIFFALNHIGAIVNLIDPRTNIEFIEKSLNDTNSCILIYIDAAYEKLGKIRTNKKLKNIFYLPVSSSFPKYMKTIYNFKNLKVYNKLNRFGHKNWIYQSAEFNKEDYKAEKNLSDDIAAIVYTSGTTEIPKGALLTNKNIIALTIQNKISDFGWDKYDRFLEIMPPFIAYGLLCGIVIPFCIGMQVIVIPKFNQKKFADLIIKYKPNHIMGVPSMMTDLKKNKKLIKFDLSFLKTVIVGGDKISIADERSFNSFLKSHNSYIKLIKGYGMTEMSSNAVFTKDNKCNIEGSVGIPLFGNNIRIIDSKGEELKYGIEGEICLTGPTLIKGYYRNDKLTKQVFINEKKERWIHSGDLGYINEDGVLFIEGRIKRMIIRFDGFKVIPGLIEESICLNENVKSCAVVGMKDETHGQGQLPIAWVVLNNKENKDIIKEELIQMCKSTLPEYEQPEDLKFIDELPLTPVGKVDYKTLEKLAENSLNF